jgi:HD superfamily phosphohydrolases
VLDEGNVQTAESLLLARALMNPTVYAHHVARIAKAMLRQASERLLESGTVDAHTLRRMDDYGLRTALRECNATQKFARRLDTRQLYKRAAWAELDAVPDSLLTADHNQIQTLERDVAEAAGVDPTSVIIDLPPPPSMAETTSQVMINGDVRQLEDQSALVGALRQAQTDNWRLGIYSPGDDRDRVRDAVVRELGLDRRATTIPNARSGVNATLDAFADRT